MPGGSWKTGLAGWIAIGVDLLGLIGKTIQEQGFPKDLNTWIVFGSVLAAGIGNIVSKDYDKSNAPVPTAEAKTVPTPTQ